MAHLESLPVHQFRVPASELNRAFRKWGATMLIGLILAHLLVPQGLSTSTVILVAILGGAGYYYAKHHVWVCLSADGICGTGYTGREVQISWHEAITVNTARKSDMDGVEIRLARNDSLLKRSVLSLFIPHAIVTTREFSTALSKLAPADHPLRKISTNAP
jgi:hypothetical protein